MSRIREKYISERGSPSVCVSNSLPTAKPGPESYVVYNAHRWWSEPDGRLVSLVGRAQRRMTAVSLLRAA